MSLFKRTQIKSISQKIPNPPKINRMIPINFVEVFFDSRRRRSPYKSQIITRMIFKRKENPFALFDFAI